MAYITVGTGEGEYQVWQDDPVPARLDPELPQPEPPPPAPTATSTTASNNAATTGNGTSTPAGNQSTPTATSSTVDLTAQIRGEVGAGPKDNQGYLNLLLNKYSAADLAKAYPEFGTERDYQVAKDGLPKGLIVPGSLDSQGRVQAVQGTPEFIQAEQLVRQASRDAIRKAAIANGFPPDAAIPTSGDPTTGKVYITLQSGKDIDITSYFEGLPKSPVAIPLNVATYGTSTVTTPFRTVTVTALPEVARTVNTSEGSIVVDANSEVARLIQWKGSQPGLDGRPIREGWARAGISDPYSNPAIVAQAVEQIDRADARTALFNQNGVTPPGSQIAPWNDPKWPEYQGSNKEAYSIASAALTDVNVKNQLKAENGWDEATFQSWALKATNPEEAGRLAKIRDEAAGLVVGPSSGTTTGLSANGATAVTTSGAVNSAGFSVSSASSVATNQSPPSIDTFVANYWKAGQAGDSGPFAGGTLQRLNATNAVFIKGKDYYYIDNRSTVDELANIPGFIAAIEANIGAVPQTGDRVLTNAAGQATGVVNTATGVVTGVVAAAGAVAVNAAGVVTGVVDTVTGVVGNLPAIPAIPALPVPVLPDLAAIATGFTAGFTDALPTLPSITGALQLSAAQVAGLAQAAEDTAAGLLADIKRLPAAIPDSLSPYVTAAAGAAAAATGLTAINDLLVRQNATIQKAKEQATLEARNNTAASTTDWRVRLQLAPGATYLYKDPEPGILKPLMATDGVIFPYTPSIETAYTANYDKYDLTHSNYRGYFYKNSAVNDINIRGTFTAQDTFEAEYLLAVIHFFRSITKMFYGQDSLRGAPPPLVYLSGFGDYQFNKHPCLVSNFSYSLPTDVDYIRALAPNNYGNLFSQRAKSGGFSTNPFGSVLSRLTSIGVPVGAEPSSPTPGEITQNVNNLTGATYVPTKIEINLTLLPTNTRAQVSQQFSLKKYADGSLIKGGYW
jgi:hypothetical protein